MQKHSLGLLLPGAQRKIRQRTQVQRSGQRVGSRRRQAEQT